jgi:aconitate hydratase
VIAESFERIHRTNLVGMGVLPLQFRDGEQFSVAGVKEALSGTERHAHVRAVDDAGGQKTFDVLVRVDTPQEVEYYRYGGILPYVLRQIAEAPVAV